MAAEVAVPVDVPFTKHDARSHHDAALGPAPWTDVIGWPYGVAGGGQTRGHAGGRDGKIHRCKKPVKHGRGRDDVVSIPAPD